MKIKVNISLKLIGLMLAVSVLPLLVFQLVSYRVVSQTTVEVATHHYAHLLQSELSYLNLQTDQIDALGESPVWADELRRLRAMAEMLQGEDANYVDLLTQERLGQLLSGYANLGGLDSIDLYTPDGFHYHMGEPLGQTKAVRLNEQISRAKEAAGRNVWLGIDAANPGFNNRNVIVSVKSIYSSAAGGAMPQSVGVLRCNLSTEYLYGHFNNLKLDPGAQLLLVDDQRRLLFHADKKLIGQPLAEGLAPLLLGASGTLTMQFGQDDVLLSYRQVPDKNWYLISIVPQTTLLAPMRLIKRANVALLLAGLLLIALITLLYTRRVVEPLQLVSDAFRNYQAGHLVPDWRLPKLKAWVQIAELANWFNAFLDSMQSQRQSQQALRESEERYRTAFLTSPDSVNITRLSDGLYLDVNEGFLKTFGWTREECLGRTTADIKLWHNPQDRDRLVEAVQRDGYCENFEASLVTRDARILTCLMSVHVLDFKGQRCILAVTRDITARKAAEDQLRKLSQALEQSSDSVIITDIEGNIEYVNEAFVRNTGYSREEALGKNPRMLKSGSTPRETYSAMWTAINSGQPWSGELVNRRKDGTACVEWTVLSPIRQADGKVTHYVAVQTDITVKKQTEERINNLAFFDALTELPNRRLLLDRMKQALASNARNERYGALMFIDLDNFKTLNDSLGHDIGDLLLQQTAQRLVGCVREGDTVARLGGDEFVLLLESLSENAQDAAASAEAVGSKVLQALNQPYQLAGITCHSSASIGVTLFVDHQGSMEDLLKRADLAMYQAKEAGRNTLRFFEPEMQATVAARAELESDLHAAVRGGQFAVYYQAQIDRDGAVTGVEALLRWKHPQRGLVSPLTFIVLAERTGLIVPIGRWVLEKACSQLHAWSHRPEMRDLSIAVNVSARQLFQADFVEQVLAILEKTGANPKQLKLELTESVLVTNIEDIITKMQTLKTIGVGFSLDDFGTGYSSLSYLKRLPLDQLKIDQSFVRDILTDPNDAAIAKMVIALAYSLGLAVIAEGVETLSQRDFLAVQGCHAYQGYLFSKPVAIEEFEDFALKTGCRASARAGALS